MDNLDNTQNKANNIPAIDTSQLQPYIDAGFQLIPLHAWDYVDANNRKRGKSPRDRSWPTKDYNNKHVVQLAKEGSNVGVRLTDTILVVDVDPRNFEDEDSLAKLCADFNIDINDYPVVKTGAGGLHIYMQIAAGQTFVDSHPNYPGVEFKSRSRQVVAAGSIHPDTGQLYKWAEHCKTIDLVFDLIAAPESLLTLIKRQPLEPGSSGEVAGIYSQELLAKMLEALDPVDFNTNDKWAPLMMACHHATDGAGRQEFIDWCEQDPEYAGDRSIGARWDSCRNTGDGPKTTYRTLNSLLIKANAAHLIPAPDVSQDFPDVAADDMQVVSTETTELNDAIDMVNEKYAFIEDYGGKAAVVKLEPITLDRITYVKWKPRNASDFKLTFNNRKASSGAGKDKKLGDVWMDSPRRRQYERMEFKPEGQTGPNVLNTWTGWAVKPSAAGTCNYLNELIAEVLCGGDEAVYSYVMNWCARYVQKPSEQGQVAICFTGKKGVGKSTLGRILAQLAGNHGLHITSQRLLTGNFNAHLKDLIFLFADEASSASSKEANSTLKGLITEPTLIIERKGWDVEPCQNTLHIMMASNDELIVPAGTDNERRYMVQEANDLWLADNKKSQFKELHQELQAGGLQRFMFDLLHRDIASFDVYDIPVTQAFGNQVLGNLNTAEEFWYTCLSNGYIKNCAFLRGTDWETDSVAISTRLFAEAYEQFYRQLNSKDRPKIKQHAKAINNFMPSAYQLEQTSIKPSEDWPCFAPELLDPQGRVKAFKLPPLEVCKQAFSAETKILKFEN